VGNETFTIPFGSYTVTCPRLNASSRHSPHKAFNDDGELDDRLGDNGLDDSCGNSLESCADSLESCADSLESCADSPEDDED